MKGSSMNKQRMEQEIKEIKKLQELNKIEEASALASDLALNFPRSGVDMMMLH